MLSGIRSMHFTMIVFRFHCGISRNSNLICCSKTFSSKNRSPTANPVTDCSEETLATSET